MDQTANGMPQVTLGQYKGFVYTRRVRPVSERTVELEASNLTRSRAPLCPVAAPAARGDRVTLDFEGFLDGEPIPDSRMEAVTVLLGTGQLMPAAEQVVYGHCAGEVFRFDFTYPDEFRVAELSGKTAQFEIHLHAVERKQIPPLDDAFAKTLGFETVEALKANIREKKRLSHEANADRIAGTALLDMAGAALQADLPAEPLENSAQYEMRQLTSRLTRSGLTLEKYCQDEKTTPEQLHANYRAEAERKMRALLAVRAIAEAEQITVSRAEIEQEYLRLSKLHETPMEEIRCVLGDDSIAAAVTNRKVQRFLIDHANLTSVVEKE